MEARIVISEKNGKFYTKISREPHPEEQSAVKDGDDHQEQEKAQREVIS